MTYYPAPPGALLRFERAGRLLADGCCSVMGDAASPCFRFSVALANAGVLEEAKGVDAEVDAPGVAALAGWGTVLFCFRGELVAEGGPFWGVGGPWSDAAGGPVGAETPLKRDTGGVGLTPFRVWKF